MQLDGVDFLELGPAPVFQTDIVGIVETIEAGDLMPFRMQPGADARGDEASGTRDEDFLRSDRRERHG